jgi:hypothetical protein
MMKVDGDWKKTIKGLSSDLDMSMVKLTKNLAEYKEEIRELIKKRD